MQKSIKFKGIFHNFMLVRVTAAVITFNSTDSKSRLYEQTETAAAAEEMQIQVFGITD